MTELHFTSFVHSAACFLRGQKSPCQYLRSHYIWTKKWMKSSTPFLDVRKALGERYPAAGLQPTPLSLAFAICNCVTTAGAAETVPLRNHYLKGLQRSKKPTNPSPNSGTALIIPTAAAIKLFLRDIAMQVCQKHHQQNKHVRYVPGHN